MSHLPAPDRTAVPTTLEWIEAVGYLNARVTNVSASTTANFTQPALHSTVTVSVTTSTAFIPGDTVAVSGALSTYRGGFYYVMSKPSATSLLLKLVDDGLAPGSTVASGADVRTVTPILVTPRDRGQLIVTDLYCDSLVCPGFGDTTRPTVSIGWNRGGTPFSEFYNAQQLNFASTRSSGTTAASLGAAFTQPAVGASVTARLATPGVYALGTWGFPLGTILRVMRGGVYEVTGFTTTTTTANFTQPAVNASVTINVSSSTGFAIGDFIFVSTTTVAGAGAYEITATTATSITATLRNIGSSFLPGVASAATVASGSTVTHGQKFELTLRRDSQLDTGQSVATGNSVFAYSDARAVTVASYVQPTSGLTVVVTVDDNRTFVVGTTVWVSFSPTSSAGLYSVTSKTGLDRLTLTLSTVIDYASGSTVPSGATIHVRRQAGQVLPLRGFGTTRLAVEPGCAVAGYVSVSGNATSADIAAIFLRGYYVS